ncbi:MAG TPA: hypothetical protein VMC62_04190 [Longilinea sp.]|nr:hypothetical protein [Longilinea sp.]
MVNQTFTVNFKSILVWTAAICAPLVMAVIFLSVWLPPGISQWLSSYSTAFFFILLALYAGCFSIKNRPLRWALGFLLTLLLFSFTLSWLWTSGFSGNKIIGGILPYKDGYYYYQGAQMLSMGQVIPLSGLQAVWRPLFPGFLSVLQLFTGNDLLWCLGILAVIAAAVCYLAAWQIANRHPAVVAALFITLLWFYALPFVGYTWTELLGLTFGCLGFVLLWNGAERLKLWDMALGTAVLTIGISIRAGAFFILPLLVLWVGWALRGKKRFALKPAAVVAAAGVASFLLANIIYTHLITAPGGETFGNFAGALYGQAVGGAGYTAAGKLGADNAMTIYEAVLERLRNYPLGMVIGSAKAYRDFFVPNSKGIFVFISSSSPQPLDVALWVIALGLLFWSLARSIRNIRDPLASFQLACFIGIFLSIPFLPPIDGGSRFYAGTMPFFYILPAMALEAIPGLRRAPETSQPDDNRSFVIAGRLIAGVLTMLILFVAPLIRFTGSEPQAASLTCPVDQKAFTIQVPKDSYLDVVPDGLATCGKVPEVCLADLLANGKNEVTDDFYMMIVGAAQTSSEPIRVLPAINLTDQSYSYFIGEKSLLEPANSDGLISGCAVKVPTQYQTVYRVESVIP